MSEKDRDPRPYRTIWISDLHMGARESQAERLLDFLKRHESEYLYLVGDVIDGWRLKRGWFWRQSFNDVIQKLLRRARKGCKVYYIPGNHDAFARPYCGLAFGEIRVCRQVFHATVDGRRLLVLHGDEFDSVVTSAPWLARLGSVAYDVALQLNLLFNMIRRRLGFPYWSLSAYLKHKVKNAVMFMDRFEHTLAGEAKRRGADGVVCGHIHHAAVRTVDGVAYYNTGDWVESCTALVEHFDGSMEILNWASDAPAARTAEIPESAAALAAG
jgi:UDP-2,3-diacylglucosamine pyrophosphatase LpxH